VPPVLSACLIVKNEAANLPRCLASLQGVADEVIVVDTGSQDETMAIARRFGARVFELPWPDDFSAARNHSIAQASGGWVLILDADEELPAETRAALPRLLEVGRAQSYRFVVRNLQPPGDQVAYVDLPSTRLFRRDPRYRYEGIIHEQITASILAAGGSLADSGLVLLHYGYQVKTAQHETSRAERNLALLKKALEETPGDAYLLYQTGATLKALACPAEALDYLRRSLAGTPPLAPEALEQAHTRLAQLYLEREDNPQALAHALACLRLNPRSSPVLYIAGLALFAQGKLREAYPYFETLSGLPEVNPEDLEDLKEMMAYIRANSG
jgi:tetratricopeptide (TPR) repeat protein